MKPATINSPSRSERALAKMVAVSADQGLICLSNEWQGVGAKYQFRCGQGHQFERAAYGVLYKASACPECSRGSTASKFDNIVAERGGQCLSGGYRGSAVPHRLRCSHGHEWATLGSSILQGNWCPYCAGHSGRPAKGPPRKYGLADLQAKAAEYGGKCLATWFSSARAHYPFECASGHQWDAIGYKVLRAGNWCRVCTDARLAAKRTDADGLNRLKSVARARGGVCLSDSYRGANERYKFRCAVGHQWEALATNILQGRWCRTCHNESLKTGIEAMHAFASERGGRCLSDTYDNGKAKLTWECHHGHVWQARSESIRAGHWCPSCAIQSTIRAKNAWKHKRYEAGNGSPSVGARVPSSDGNK